MLKLKPRFLKRNGKKQFVVLSIEDFDRILEAIEDADDLRALREAKRRNGNSPGIPLEEMMRRLGMTPSRKRKAG